MNNPVKKATQNITELSRRPLLNNWAIGTDSVGIASGNLRRVFESITRLGSIFWTMLFNSSAYLCLAK